MKIYLRKNSRIRIVQALYSWQLSNNKSYQIKNFFYKKYKKKIDFKYFNEIFLGIIKNKIKIDNLIKPCILRNLNRLSEVEKSILRMSVYELLKRKDIPYKVIINEGIEIAKIFGSKDSHKFINGVLDKIAIKIRFKKIA
ncbi:transcription antitermination factor NusB [Buchnera aphidicola]|uniref:transcription antitermination factor NusB n=1 Tax=Buchnera aphidicola TaxID=9 RepID=UPI002237BBA6|nr:transcription antitermination factor NusB [Buchnera aphidicola]MCW5197532.1 transcription antitermination factor NusB [Buchnera aphidicola (Chaitophorus viminalis)]